MNSEEQNGKTVLSGRTNPVGRTSRASTVWSTTLLLLTLLMGMSLTMVLGSQLRVAHQRLLWPLSRLFLRRGLRSRSGTPADSGINLLNPAIPAGWSPVAGAGSPTPPPPGASAQIAITAAFAVNFIPVNTANSWQERFKVTNVHGSYTKYHHHLHSPVGGMTGTSAAPE